VRCYALRRKADPGRVLVRTDSAKDVGRRRMSRRTASDRASRPAGLTEVGCRRSLDMVSVRCRVLCDPARHGVSSKGCPKSTHGHAHVEEPSESQLLVRRRRCHRTCHWCMTNFRLGLWVRLSGIGERPVELRHPLLKNSSTPFALTARISRAIAVEKSRQAQGERNDAGTGYGRVSS